MDLHSLLTTYLLPILGRLAALRVAGYLRSERQLTDDCGVRRPRYTDEHYRRDQEELCGRTHSKLRIGAVSFRGAVAHHRFTACFTVGCKHGTVRGALTNSPISVPLW